MVEKISQTIKWEDRLKSLVGELTGPAAKFIDSDDDAVSISHDSDFKGWYIRVKSKTGLDVRYHLYPRVGLLSVYSLDRRFSHTPGLSKEFVRNYKGRPNRDYFGGYCMELPFGIGAELTAEANNILTYIEGLAGRKDA